MKVDGLSQPFFHQLSISRSPADQPRAVSSLSWLSSVVFSLYSFTYLSLE
jgi:hypothetical protein